MREDPRESQGSALVRGKTPLEILDEVIQKTPLDAREALAGPLKDKYLEAIRSEWENLRKKILVPISKQEL